MKTLSSIVLTTLLSFSLGCSVYKMTGDTMVSYGKDHMIPFLIADGDTDVTCATGLAMGGFLNSFARVTQPPHKAAVVTLLSSSTCSELISWESELASARAAFRGDAAGAKDARIAEMRAHQTTAFRLYRAYKRAVAQYGEPGGPSCPVLETEFDEFVWLLGMMAVVQGVQHDRAARASVGIPLDVPLKAARGTQCLNNSRS